MTSGTVDLLPEWEPFADAARKRRPNGGTWCEAWTVRDVVAHQAGTANELARVLLGHMEGDRVPTRSFEEREAPFHAMDDHDLWAATSDGMDHLAEACSGALRDLGPEADVGWTGRTMEVAWFAEHMREELVLHRWDLVGDDRTATLALSEAWMTEHSVTAVGRPLLMRGLATLDLGPGVVVEGRLRVSGTDDVVVRATADDAGVARGRPQGRATVESDAAARVLMLWGRRPSDPSRWRSDAGTEQLRQVRVLLSGY